ncbi:MAG: DNA methyltransferase [Patescibacteria group bacterium]|jgi:DNA modification methylase
MDGKYSNAINRWEGVGPYYAMFPALFASNVIKKYTKSGDVVLDPFMGRGTSVFAATTNGRVGIGMEINPVGWVYAKTKLSPAPKEKVIKRLCFLDSVAYRYKNKAKLLPIFFRYCYSDKVVCFLLAARAELKWKTNQSDATLMALILVSLHGKYGNALSNQMRQTKSMSPKYSINWWKERKLLPPQIDPVDFLKKRIEWRYKNGVPPVHQNFLYLGDSSLLLNKASKQIIDKKYKRPKLLFTSPPYLGITNYHYDQWLRLWMLGYAAEPKILKDKYRRKFDNLEEYTNLLEKVFQRSAKIMHPDATIYVRTDYRKETYQITKDILQKTFPRKKLIERVCMFHKPTQTNLFRKKSSKKYKENGGEVDLILIP